MQVEVALEELMSRKPNVKLPGKVDIELAAYEPEEKAEISIEGADPLYREIRIENSLTTHRSVFELNWVRCHFLASSRSA